MTQKKDGKKAKKQEKLKEAEIPDVNEMTEEKEQ